MYENCRCRSLYSDSSTSGHGSVDRLGHNPGAYVEYWPGAVMFVGPRDMAKGKCVIETEDDIQLLGRLHAASICVIIVHIACI